MPEIVSDQARSAELQLSIHSESAFNFLTSEVQSKSWATEILTNGYMPDFVSLPTPYVKPNNKSACEHIDVVREKLSEWVQEGFVEELAVPAHCCNPCSC
jgi:hypothetical protein